MTPWCKTQVFVCISIPFLIPQLAAQSVDGTYLRDRYFAAESDAEAAHAFYDTMAAIGDTKSPVVKGYQAMASFMMSHHNRAPLAKLKYFAEGQRLLADAIKELPEDVELHFLRFTVQTSAPEFLNYRRNIHEDKKILLRAISLSESPLDDDLRKRVVEFLMSSRYCSQQDREEIRKHD